MEKRILLIPKEIKDYIETFRHHKIESDNDSRETPIEEEKEPYTKLEKISFFLCILSAIIMATFLLYLLLSSVSFIAEHFSQFTWKVFNLL